MNPKNFAQVTGVTCCLLIVSGKLEGLIFLRVKMMEMVLDALILSPHFSVHVVISFSLSCIWSLMIAMFSSDFQMALSSAYKDVCILFSVCGGKSFISNMKRMGEMTLPWGTPFWMLNRLDTVECFLF